MSRPTVALRPRFPHVSPRAAVPDPRLDAWLRRSVAIGIALVVLLPFARSHNAVLGFMPLWLLGMPASAWWALHRFCLPRPWRVAAAAGTRARPRRRAQATRRSLPAQRLPRRLSQAA